jgi:hypothetical protein
MDEFDIELDSDIGTSVSKIKKYSNESEFDYDKVMEILNNSETINTHENVNEKSKDFLEYEHASFESKDSKTSMLLNNLSKTQIIYEPYQAKLDKLNLSSTMINELEEWLEENDIDEFEMEEKEWYENNNDFLDETQKKKTQKKTQKK